MLAHLRLRVIEILSSWQTATLSTSGPAGIQTRNFPCEAQGLLLYILLPSTSDHLLNIEHDPAVVVSTPEWQLRGLGRILLLTAAPLTLTLPHSPLADGCVLVEVRALRLHINRKNGWGFSETIDVDQNWAAGM